MRRFALVLLTIVGLFLSTLGPALAAPPSPVIPFQTPTPAPNPRVAEQCGLPVTLVLDASGSIQSSNAVGIVRQAAAVFLDAIKDTGSTARVIDFGTFSRQTAGPELVTTASMAKGGIHNVALADYYAPQTPVTPPATETRQYKSGSLSNTGNFGSSSITTTQWTNWDSALDRTNDDPGELVFFVTDGDPTAIDLNKTGDAFNPPGTTVANDTFRSQGVGPSVDRAVEEANLIKDPDGNPATADGSRILAVGVGAAVTQPASVERLKRIAGPQVATDEDIGDIDSINDLDVAVVEDFRDLAALLKGVVTELCSPSLAVRKFVQSAESTNYVEAGGWSITVDPGVEGEYRWIQPAGGDEGPRTRQTNPAGFANFQWEPDPPNQNSNAVITEELEDDYVGGRAVCEILPPDADAEFIHYPDASEPLEVPMGPEDIVTCTLFNNFDYQPGINLEKTADPLVVRGDGGGTTVTYTGVVTNTGNTPLVLTDGDDPGCSVIEFTGGDENDDGRLDLDEAWTFECTRVQLAGLIQEEIFRTNVANVSGVAPNGDPASDSDDAVVEVLTPAINLEKEADQDLVVPGTTVNYTFTVTNLGNDPLSDITLTDDQCGTPTFVDGDTDGDGSLDLDETWTYTCAVVIGTEDPTINQALVTGTPSVGDDVSEPAEEDIDLINPSLLLTKEPSALVVFEGGEVTYTYEVSTPGEEPLTPGPGLTREDMLVDDSCTDITFIGGDVGDDSILQPGGAETWIYECTTTLDVSTVNIATVTMQGEVSGTIIRNDDRFVLVVPTGIDIIKTASEDLVPSGTDVTYTYEVTNPGSAPLAEVTVDDDFCSPVEFVEGDTNGDGLLDPTELFLFTCTATLTEDTTNTAVVTGTPTLGENTGTPVTADDPASVDVFTSEIELVKTASDELVRVGNSVTFTFVATNTGDISLVPLGIVDDQCDPIEFIGGDPEGDGRMEPGEAWTWECSKEMNADTTNTAVIEAVDPTGETVTDDDAAEVSVFDSVINLEKAVDPQLVPAGALTTFTFTVTNPGPVPLSDITLTDDTCSPLSFVGGDSNGDEVLQVDEAWTYTCTAPITEATSNVAEVEGTDPDGGKPTDTGVAGAIPYNPSLEVVKAVEPFQVQPGGSVTYTYAVTNTGDVPVAGVRGSISDDKCAPVSYVSGDVNNNGLLDADIEAAVFEYTSTAETWVFTCTTTIEEDTTNVVTVTGIPTDPDGNRIGPDVSDNDEAAVEVIDELPATGIAPIWMALAALLAALGAFILVANRRRLRSR